MSDEELKFIRLRETQHITKRQFDKLDTDDKVSTLEDLLINQEEERSELEADLLDTKERWESIDELIMWHLDSIDALEVERGRRTEINRRLLSVKDQIVDARKETGRFGGYSRAYYSAVRKGLEARVIHYELILEGQRELVYNYWTKIRVERGVIEELEIETRSYEEIDIGLETERTSLRYDEERESVLDMKRLRIGDKLKSLQRIIDEIQKEIKELRLKPKIVRHKYVTARFIIWKTIEYASREVGSDIDIEITVVGTLRFLIPTSEEGKELSFLDKTEPMLRDKFEEKLDIWVNEEYFAITIDAGIRCNVEELNIVEQKYANVSKFYKDITSKTPDKYIRSKLTLEQETYTRLVINSVQFMRANTIGDRKSRRSDLEYEIRRYLVGEASQIVEDIIDFITHIEITNIKTYLGGEE